MPRRFSRGVVVSSLLSVLGFAGAAHPQSERPREPAPNVGTFDGQVRTYFMVTQNEVVTRNQAALDAGTTLRDWHSWAVGGRLGYHTPSYHGVGLGITAYTSRAVVGDGEQLDVTTGRPSRYEVGLYNVADSSDKEVTLIGEAYVDLKRGGHQFWAGRHTLQTPLFNPQDGRMIPTLAQGVWYGYEAPFGLTLQGGYLGHVAGRGFDRFSKVRDSIGLFPGGRNVEGAPSAYAGNTDSDGLVIASVAYEHTELSVNVWDYHVENVFNALYADAYVEPRWFGLDWRLGGQYILEHKVGDGGSVQPSRAYFEDDRSQAFGAQLQARTKDAWLFAGNYNRITAEGRFLFPREWGREPLFVFQKRERVEGNGDLHAFLLEVSKPWGLPAGAKFTAKLGYGHYYLPPPTEAALNKYAMPSYRQVNLDVFYHFGGDFQGLVAELLVAYKGHLGDEVTNPAFTLNKVDMLLWNCIVNYAF